MLVGLEKITLVNFPGRVACAIFLPGCNMRCGFCHNSELVLQASYLDSESASSLPSSSVQVPSNQYYPIEEVFAFLRKRRGVLSGVVITGGEPFASPHLYNIVEEVIELGLALKIDTNGLFPEKLRDLLCGSKKHLRPQMIALDVKTVPTRYIELMPKGMRNGDAVANKILESLALLKGEVVSGRDLLVDYRTVLIPHLVGENEIRTIASYLPSQAMWSFAEFIPGACLDPSWNLFKCYSQAEMRELVDIAKSLVQGATLR